MKQDNTLKAVLVGCGGISGSWLKACREFDDLQIVALVDVIEENARKKAIEFNLGDIIISSDLDDVLSKSNIDIVFDCTNPESHKGTVLTAAKHNCHILGEKPMADTIENARQMIDAVDATGKTYAVIQNRRYLSPVVKLKELLDSGTIGQITTIDCDFYIAAHFGGFREQMNHVLLLDMAIHPFDTARMISSAEPVSVFCKDWNPSGSWYKHGASAIAIFQMTNNIVYSYRGSWCSYGQNTSWEAKWRIIGTKGTILWDGEQDIQVEVLDRIENNSAKYNKTVKEMPEPLRYEAHAGVIRNFLDCVKSGQTPQTVCTDNIKSLAMVSSAIESAENSKLVVIDV